MGIFEGPRWHLPLQRTFFTCVAFGLTVGSLAPPSFGQSSGQIVAGNTYAVVGVGDSDVLNIRSEPNPSASAAGSIPPKGKSIVASGAVVRQGSALWRRSTTKMSSAG
jgi:hypothetical protein